MLELSQCVIGYFTRVPSQFLNAQVDVSRGERLLTLQLFAPAVCKQLIDLAATFDDWATLTDSVDRQPEQQHNIYDFAKVHLRISAVFK